MPTYRTQAGFLPNRVFRNTATSKQEQWQEAKSRESRKTRILGCCLLLIQCNQLIIYYQGAWLGNLSILLGATVFFLLEIRCSGKMLSLAELVCFFGLIALSSVVATKNFASKQQLHAAEELLQQGKIQTVCMRVNAIEPAQSDSAYRFIASIDTKKLNYSRRNYTSVSTNLLRAQVEASPLKLTYQPREGDTICGDFKFSRLLERSNLQIPAINSFKGRLIRAGAVLQAKLQKQHLHLNQQANLGQANLGGNQTKPQALGLLKKFPDKMAAPLVYAIVLGRKDLLPSSLKEMCQDLGISHLLVISGFHLAAISMMLRFFLLLVIRPVAFCYQFGPVERQATVLALVGVWFYYAILPRALPVLRAVVGASLYLCVIRRSRKLSFIRCLFTTAIILSLLEPASLCEVGAQLTFAALFGLWLGSRVEEQFRDCSGVFKALRVAICLSFAAWLATTPLVLFYFQKFIPLGAVFSLLFSPVFALVVLFPATVLLLIDKLSSSLPDELWLVYLNIVEFLLSIIDWLHVLLGDCVLGAWEVSQLGSGTLWLLYGFAFASNSIACLWISRAEAQYHYST